MNLPAGKAGPQLFQEKKVPGRNGIDATFAGQFFDGKVEASREKSGRRTRPWTRPGSASPP